MLKGGGDRMIITCDLSANHYAFPVVTKHPTCSAFNQDCAESIFSRIVLYIGLQHENAIVFLKDIFLIADRQIKRPTIGSKL